MSPLIEHASTKAARILDSARELALEHGVRKVTIAEIAAAAGVGKGTVYLYWETKEDLFAGLVAREVLVWLDDVIARITADPGMVLLPWLPLLITTLRKGAADLAPLLIRSTLGNPWLRRLRSDDSALRQMLHRPADRERLAEASPSAMGNEVVTVLRESGIVRDDLPQDRQMYALHALLVGFSAVMENPAGAGEMNVGDPELALAETMHLLLEPPEDPAPAVIAGAADEVVARFTRIHASVLELVTPGAAGTR